ncbi:MAG TPA: Mur ligase domain-containing protein [Patescibacteria group bacterium]|nr:Mur ligase domain-containing protein [Patescibacteria group bacterium]
MHIFFSGIGGAGIGPLALVAKQAGHEVSGSDKQDSQYVAYLKKHGIPDIHIGQSREYIAAIHDKKPIDWYVYSSAIEKENADAEELRFVSEQDIKTSKRDGLINAILDEKHLKMIAIAGTHGKTTTTTMVVWLFKQLEHPVSYSLGAKISFGDMGEFEPKSEYFVYECDEFDRNFLAFEPYISLISGVSWDHHEIFPTREDYKEAFKEFISQSKWTILWQEDANYLGLETNASLSIQDSGVIRSSKYDIQLPGLYTRLDAWLAIQAVHEVTNEPVKKLVEHMNKFPGLQRRMEEIVPGLYSDYAHTPEKIRGAMSVALEMAKDKKQNVVVVYEPLTNRRQHYMAADYKDCFKGAKKVYWVPSYLAREDPAQHVLRPDELVKQLDDPSIAEPAQRDKKLVKAIQEHLDGGDMVVCMAGGGGDSLDEWIREEFGQ